MLKEFLMYCIGQDKTGKLVDVKGYHPILQEGTSLTGIEEHALKPYRAKVQESFISLKAFTDFVAAFSTGNTIIVGKTGGEGGQFKVNFRAVINYHGRPVDGQADTDGVVGKGDELEPNWADQTVNFDAPLDPDFVAWLKMDGKDLSQRELHNFLLDYAPNFVTPDSTSVLEIAGKLKVVGELSASSNVQGGGVDLLLRETKQLTTENGQTIPDLWRVKLPVIKGVPGLYELPFRVLWDRNHRDGINLHIKLVRPHMLLDAAFNDAAATIREATQVAVFGEDPQAGSVTA